MSAHLSILVPLHLSAEDDESPSDSSHSTPRSSFLLYHDPPGPQYSDDLPRRPHSLVSLDSGYFSIMAKDTLPKSFSRKPSGVDLRVPLFPLSNATDPSQISPKRDGMIRNLLRKKKKSMLSESPPDLDTLPFRHSPGEPVQQIHLAPVTRTKSRDPSVDAFEERDRFVVKQGMRHHPYPRNDAPYMLSYDRTVLDNDKYWELLLRRLNHTHSPSFHDFAHAPPKTILDLGCGSGRWAIEAAEYWPSSQVIGFDLIDPTRLRCGVETPWNVQWKRGNFVKYKLPFPKNMFDLVRMANLSLCIPQNRWEHVVSEARRVLAQGGRLELIDDYMFFPYTKRLPQPWADSFGLPRMQSSSSFEDDDDDITEDTVPGQPAGDDADDDEDEDDDDDDDFVSTKSRFSSAVDAYDLVHQPGYDPVTDWHRNVEDSKSLEQVFEDMLSHKFAINPRPSKHFDDVLDRVFGRHHQHRLHEFNLYLAPPPNPDSDDSSIGSWETQGSGAALRRAGKDFARWMTAVEWDHHHKEKERRCCTKGDRSSDESLPGLSIVPDMISPKAAGRLGIKPTPQPSHPHATQSPGLVLWPATFIPIPPFELEMHTCKHLHSLIGCKAALMEYFQDVARDRRLTFDPQMLDDLIWDYESFRRKRFNWPSECPDAHNEVLFPLMTTPRPKACSHSNESPLHHQRPRDFPGRMGAPPEPLYPRDKLDLVRCIRVYSATKLDEESHI